MLLLWVLIIASNKDLSNLTALGFHYFNACFHPELTSECSCSTNGSLPVDWRSKQTFNIGPQQYWAELFVLDSGAAQGSSDGWCHSAHARVVLQRGPIHDSLRQYQCISKKIWTTPYQLEFYAVIDQHSNHQITRYTARCSSLTTITRYAGEPVQGHTRDIVITRLEGSHIGDAMTVIVTQLVVALCPDSNKWVDYSMTKRSAAMTPWDQPLRLRKTNTFPFGVFNINEGSKRGCVDVVQVIQEKSTLTEEEWVECVHIVMGDRLTANNLCAAWCKQIDNTSPLEQLLNPKEVSVLWHYGLNVLHMIIKTHLGNSIDNPGSLASHKGLLGWVWDVNKPDYAAAKSLVRHSLIVCILNIIMWVY